MDWPTASVLIVSILSLLAAYLAQFLAPGTESTEAMGFHTSFIVDDEDGQ